MSNVLNISNRFEKKDNAPIVVELPIATQLDFLKQKNIEISAYTAAKKISKNNTACLLNLASDLVQRFHPVSTGSSVYFDTTNNQTGNYVLKIVTKIDPSKSIDVEGSMLLEIDLSFEDIESNTLNFYTALYAGTIIEATKNGFGKAARILANIVDLAHYCESYSVVLFESDTTMKAVLVVPSFNTSPIVVKVTATQI